MGFLTIEQKVLKTANTRGLSCRVVFSFLQGSILEDENITNVDRGGFNSTSLREMISW
jgi:hypothetical protein